MMGKAQGCRCWHHKFSMLLGILAMVSAVLFLYTAWRDALVWGLDATMWFEHVIVFSLVMIGLSGCGCCCGRECCNSCPVDMKKDSGMGMQQPHNHM